MRAFEKSVVRSIVKRRAAPGHEHGVVDVGEDGELRAREGDQDLPLGLGAGLRVARGAGEAEVYGQDARVGGHGRLGREVDAEVALLVRHHRARLTEQVHLDRRARDLVALEAPRHPGDVLHPRIGRIGRGEAWIFEHAPLEVNGVGGGVPAERHDDGRPLGAEARLEGVEPRFGGHEGAQQA